MVKQLEIWLNMICLHVTKFLHLDLHYLSFNHYQYYHSPISPYLSCCCVAHPTWLILPENGCVPLLLLVGHGGWLGGGGAGGYREQVVRVERELHAA